MNSLEQWLQDLFVGKLPPMSGGAKETTAKVLPWVVIVFGCLGLFGWVASLQLLFGVFGLAHYAGALYSFLVLVHLIIAPIAASLGICGGYLMLSRQRKGWQLVFYSLLIGFASTVLSLSVAGVIFNFAFGYLLFQIKESYLAV